MFSGRNGGNGDRFSEPDEEVLLQVLAGLDSAATATEIAGACEGFDTRAVSTALRKLVERGLVLETRPGRYRASGAGGEHGAILVDAGPNRLIARLPEGTEVPVNRRFRLGARGGDVVQVLVAEDGQALVTRILRRGGREVVGTVLFAPGGARLIPDNRREGQLPITGFFERFHDRYRAGDRVVGVIEVDPQGKATVQVDRILEAETPEVDDFRHVCLVHDLPGEHPPEVERAAEAFTPDFPLGSRTDCRGKLVFTIDPATAKDFDDAISLEPRPEGGWRLGVHIADVSHFVRQGSVIDAEAALRGTSIYLINRVIPMLPEHLSNGLCSLVPGEDRYCLTAFLDLDRDGRLVGTELAETLINSRHRLTYEQALEVLEGRDKAGQWPADLRETLMRVSAIAQRLRAERVRTGALNLYSVEHRFDLDVEGNPIEVTREGSDIAHQLIEECMLLANRAVAKWLVDHGSPCVNRAHAEPDPERMALFATALDNLGIEGKRAFAGRFGLQSLLLTLEGQPPATRLVLNFLCLRAFAKAVYQIDNIGHYALAFEHYAHFTSPIRRYPDLLVHRLVKRVLGIPAYKQVEARRDYLDALARQSTWLEQRSEDAERDLWARKAARYLSTRVGEVFPGVITGATGGGLFVQLLETGIDGILPLRCLTDDRYRFDAERMALVGDRSGRVLGPGAELDVRVDAVDIDRSDIVLGLVAPEGPARPAKGVDPDPTANRWKKRREKPDESGRGGRRQARRRS